MSDIPAASDFMTRKLVTLRPDQTVYEAIEIFLARSISGAPVLQGDKLVGVFSELDALKVLTQDLWHETAGAEESRVERFMTKDVITISPDLDIFSVATKFLSKPIRRLPVVDSTGRLVGQVSRRDVLKAVETVRKRPHRNSGRSFPDYRRPR